MLSARHKLLCDLNHQIYQQFPSWRSQLQSWNNHASAHVSVMETSENRTPNSIFFPISNRIVVWFECGPLIAPWWDYRICFGQKPKPLHNCVKSLNMCWQKHPDASKSPAASYSLYTLRVFKLLPNEREKSESSNSDWFGPVRKTDFQQLTV